MITSYYRSETFGVIFTAWQPCRAPSRYTSNLTSAAG